MKTKVARKQVRHAMPAKKQARTKKRVRPTAAAAKKEIVQPAAAEPQMTETKVAMFEEPIEFVISVPEPIFEVVEVFEVSEPEEFTEI